MDLHAQFVRLVCLAPMTRRGVAYDFWDQHPPTFRTENEALVADKVLYREFHTLRWVVWGLGGLSFVLVGIPAASGYRENGGLVLVAIFIFFIMQHLAAIHRWNRIELTPSRLRVGKETFGRDDFDFTFGVQPPLVLSPGEEQRVEEEWKLPPGHELRIAGGSWGRRRGTSMVVLREADSQQVVAIFTRNPQIMDQLLTEWIETVPEPPGESPGDP